ncbi:MAG: type 4a pilus biogenesis protein PilO [Candidatus Omnitrophota bacterium]
MKTGLIKPLSRREKNILGLCLLLIFIYMSVHFVFRPMNDQTKRLEKRAAEKEGDLRKALRILRKQKAVESQYAQVVALIMQKNSDEQEMASILSEIESVATEVDMRLSDMKPKKIKEIDFYHHFSVSLSVEGELETIAQFIHLLESPPHQFTMDDVRFEKRSLRTSNIKCQLTLSRILLPT